jgi:hypothetical protein
MSLDKLQPPEFYDDDMSCFILAGDLRALIAAARERDRLREAGNALSIAAQTTGGVAGHDAGLVAAIDFWRGISSGVRCDEQ